MRCSERSEILIESSSERYWKALIFGVVDIECIPMHSLILPYNTKLKIYFPARLFLFLIDKFNL